MRICRRRPSTCFAHKVVGPSAFALVGGCMCGSATFARGLTRWRAKSQPESPSKTPVPSGFFCACNDHAALALLGSETLGVELAAMIREHPISVGCRIERRANAPANIGLVSMLVAPRFHVHFMQ